MEPVSKKANSSIPAITTTNPNEEYINEITFNLLCAVCLQLSDPPLFSCHNGHFTCSNCIARLPGLNLKTKICPHCRDNGFIRNIPYEKMADTVLKKTELDCPFYEDGCLVKYKFGQQKEHLKSCKHFTQKFNCPCSNCPETKLYTLADLIEHVIIKMAMNVDELYTLDFIPSMNIGPLDKLIGSILVKLENTRHAYEINLKYNTTERPCSYSESAIIHYELINNTTNNRNTCMIYPPFNIDKNFKKDDCLLKKSTYENYEIKNYTFIIDTHQIYLVRTSCNLISKQICCDGFYLNSQYMNESDTKFAGITYKYNKNPRFKDLDESLDIIQPASKRTHISIDRLEFLMSGFIGFEKVTIEKAEEIQSIQVSVNDKDLIKSFNNIKWYLIFTV